jgi:hypothetical protein
MKEHLISSLTPRQEFFLAVLLNLALIIGVWSDVLLGGP